jgi:Uma2 family endonuclease
MSATVLNLNPMIKLTRDQFYILCAANPNAKLERNANGELIPVLNTQVTVYPPKPPFERGALVDRCVAPVDRNGIMIMSPTGGETSAWNAELNADLVLWNRQTGLLSI